MANTTRIDEVVDVASVTKQLTDTQAQSKSLREEFLLLLKTTNDLNNSLSKVTTSKGFKQAAADAEASANKIVASQDKITKAELRRQQLEAKRARIVKEGTAEDLARAQAQRTETAAIQENTQALAANEATMRRNNLAEIQGEQSAARYRQARLASLAVTTEETAAVTANTAAQAANSNALSNIGQGLTKGLGYLRTLAYILPGIGIAGLFNLAYEGISSLISGLSDGGKAIDQFAAKLKVLNDLRVASVSNSGAEIAKLDALFRAVNNLNLPYSQRIEAAKTLRDLYPKHLDNLTLDNSKTKELANNYKELKDEILNTAYVQAAFSKIAENNARIIEDVIIIEGERQKNLQLRLKLATAEQEELALNTRARNANNDALDGGARKSMQLAKAQSELAKSDKIIMDAAGDRAIINQRNEAIQRQIDARTKQSGVDILGGGGDSGSTSSNIYAQYLAQQKLILEGILKNEQSSYGDRLNALLSFERTSNLLIDRGVKADEFTLEEGKTKKLEIANESAQGRVKVESDAQKELLRLFKEGEKVQKEIAENSLSVYQQYGLQRLQQIENDKNGAIDGLIAQLDEGKISLQEYQQARADIEEQASIDSANQTIKNFQQLIEKRREYGFDVDSEEKQLFDSQKKYDDLIRDIKIKNLETVETKRRELNEKIKALEFDLAQSLLNLGQVLATAAIENQKNRLQGDSDAIEERKAREIQGVDNSLATEQEKADRIAVINAKAQSDKEAIDRRQRKLDAEKARLQKIFSLANIAINAFEKIAQVQTIGAVLLANPLTAALAPLAFSQIPFILGISAAQAAAVAAQPIPQYAKGTKNHKGGLSIIGEEGAEKVDLPNGKSFISKSTAQLINLPAGTKVTPHGETMRMIGKPDDLQRYTGGQQVPWNELMAIMNKKQSAPNVKTVIKFDGEYTEYRKRHFSR